MSCVAPCDKQGRGKWGLTTVVADYCWC